jgi:hypothetical protein
VLGKLPEEVEFVDDGEAAVTLCFLHELETISETLVQMRRIAGKTKLWILWRKKTSKLHKGITEPLIRDIAIDLGLVDYKVCAVDADWSGMAFGLRRESKHN